VPTHAIPVIACHVSRVITEANYILHQAPEVYAINVVAVIMVIIRQ